MKRLLRGLCALLLMTLLLPTALAAKATPTPPPVAISTEAPVQPPEQIQQVLDIAYNEWAELNGKTLKNVNKYTEWRGKGIGFGWCGGYITWCMMQANVEMEELEAVKKAAKESEDGVFVQVEGVHHVKEASVGKLLRDECAAAGLPAGVRLLVQQDDSRCAGVRREGSGRRQVPHHDAGGEYGKPRQDVHPRLRHERRGEHEQKDLDKPVRSAGGRARDSGERLRGLHGRDGKTEQLDVGKICVLCELFPDAVCAGGRRGVTAFPKKVRKERNALVQTE